MPLPNGQVSIAVCIPAGRDQNPLMHQITRERATSRPVTDPRTGLPVYVHPHPVRVIGNEFAAGRNKMVNLLFDAELALSADYQAAENALATSQSRPPTALPPMTFDYALWIDDDVMVPETIIEQLLAHDVQICSGLYFMRKAPYLPVAYTATYDPNHGNRFWNLTAYPPDSLMEVDGAGMGCILISMDVFRKIPAPWFAWGEPDVQAPTARERRELEKRWNASWQEEDHRSMGEDLYFCFAGGQPVFTKRGSVPIEEVRIGDEVLTHRGRWRPVYETHTREYSGEMVSLQFYGENQPAVSTPTHRYAVSRDAATYVWKEAGEIQAGERVGTPRAFDEQAPVIKVSDWIPVADVVEKRCLYDVGNLRSGFRASPPKATGI